MRSEFLLLVHFHPFCCAFYFHFYFQYHHFFVFFFQNYFKFGNQEIMSKQFEKIVEKKVLNNRVSNLHSTYRECIHNLSYVQILLLGVVSGKMVSFAENHMGTGKSNDQKIFEKIC